MPVDLDGRESHELPRTVALWDAINDVVAASGGSTTNVSVARQKAVVRVHDAIRPLADELRTLRARVAEMERDLDACRVELLEARHTVGEGWFAGGVRLAEAIERKCRALEDEVEGWHLAARGWP